MKQILRKQSAWRNESGAALIEFAFVLPILVTFLVGVIYYGFLFTLAIAVEHAAKQGAEVAVSINPVGRSTSDYQAEVTTQVNQFVTDSLAWLPSSVRDGLPDQPANLMFNPDPDGPGTLLTVSVRLAVAGNSSPLLPRVSLPLVGTVPPLPDNLLGVAQVAL